MPATIELIKSQGIKISTAVPKYSAKVHPRVSPFNDLDVVEASPRAFNVKGIKSINVYNVEKDDEESKEDWDFVAGIETTYKLHNGDDLPSVLHGRKTSHKTTIEVGDGQRIIAAFVGYNPEDKNIRLLRFTKTNVEDGSVETEGYVGVSKINSTFICNAVFGEIVAFQGIKLRGSLSKVMSVGFQTRQLGSS